jgi:hypothetical protein
MEVRVRGLLDEVLALVGLLRTVVEVVWVSAPRRDRGARAVRVYLKVRGKGVRRQ